uniref:G-protein coupled receptors family 1 profile domain-containing protein n=1 Tax=Athene cunicularia TaxID=194338 RepID=A0A663MT64_ATHCN
FNTAKPQLMYMQYLTPGVQVNMLLWISVDCFYTVVYPPTFKVFREKAKKMILSSWLLGAGFVALAFFFYGSSSDHHCPFFPHGSWQGVAYSITQLLVVFLIPASLIILFYHRLIMYIWRTGFDGRAVRGTRNIVPRRKLKTIKMLLVVSVVFLLSWLPFHVVQLWHLRATDNSRAPGFSWTSPGSLSALQSLLSARKYYRSNAYTITTGSRIAKNNHDGIADIPAPAKTVTKDSIYDAFYREVKRRKMAWAVKSDPSDNFV